MEVEARISVQAMRGRFEQRHEDGTLVSPLAQKINTSPVRTRTSSVTNKDSPNGDEGKITQKKLVLPLEVSEQDQKLLTGVKNGPLKEDSKNGSFLSDIISPVLSGSSQRKFSFDISRERREQTDVKMYETPSYSLLNKSTGEKLDSCGAEVKPSVVRRIPVFKSVDTGLNSEGKKSDKEDEEESVSGSLEKRGRFFGHIRSRSHGNFIIKREASVEKNSHSVEKGW
ncbi:uncharacterized protein LOC121871908 [Homarus americanus]|uniref:uncharacterized protein LOC121871908 n=1 Tax=Homarus americanus TaxID=6706 RepID=UPI001C45CC60|nr:uncharacterized protein LOC121871908 [Homarus americanus]